MGVEQVIFQKAASELAICSKRGFTRGCQFAVRDFAISAAGAPMME